ncbi:MBL fold metallo-hydrolase [Granulosicoccaceae sp. 1_MG-2023]|nr:MBL fold metallo-hydrolase [Granulosicoccaceae sp. 1_MG-2023]
MKYQVTPVTAYAQNSTLLWCEETREAAITDPGGDIDTLLSNVEKAGVTLSKIILTHGHIDHVGHTMELKARTGVPVIGPHPDDAFLLSDLDDFAARTGLSHSGNIEPDSWLQDGDTVTVGNASLSVVHCPGHTPGHIVLINEQDRVAIVGDVLFKGSIGRTDFPRGNHADLIHSIKHKLLVRGDDISFIPGHGPTSTFSAERLTNPYLI